MQYINLGIERERERVSSAPKFFLKFLAISRPRQVSLRLIFFVCIGFLFCGLGVENVKADIATTTVNTIFQDNFDSLSLGQLSGQNGWKAINPSYWQVIAGASGYQALETGGDGNSFSSGSSAVVLPLYPTHNTLVSVDFQAGGVKPTIYLRIPQKELNISNAITGYLLFIDTAVHLCKIPFACFPPTKTMSLTAGNWYTIQFQVIDDVSGNPVLTAWVYPQGTARPGTPSVTYTDTSKNFVNSGYVAIGTVEGVSTNFDNTVLYSDDYSPAIKITTPQRSITSTPSVATISMKPAGSLGNCTQTYTIPYIQTSSSLTVSASVAMGSLPSGGGVKFILDSGQLSQQILYSHSTLAPFTVTFTAVQKGEHTLDTYVVDSSDNIPDLTQHDFASNIGVGDIYTAIGDSLTDGSNGTIYTAANDWTTATVKSNDNRNFPTCANKMATAYIEINNDLENVFGYPVYIFNEGKSGFTTTRYLSELMPSSYWINDISNIIKPNKWLIHLGVNDPAFSISNATSNSNLQQIITNLKTTYGSETIYLASPGNMGTALEPYIDNLVVTNSNVIRGPKFSTIYTNYPSLLAVDGLHFTTAGQTHAGYLWASSIAHPQSVIASQNTGTATIDWGAFSLGSGVLSNAGYKVKYGTSSGDYTNTIDVGNVTTKSITGLTGGQTYYFTVAGYDNDSFIPNLTSNAPEVSLTMASTDTTLSDLTISQGTLSPEFSSSTTTYTVDVINDVTSLTVTPTVNQANATVTVNGTAVATGVASDPITLNVGANTITTIVTAQDGTTTGTYTITVTREGSTDATLSNLVISSGTLAPTFSSGTTSYTTSVGHSTSEVTITPTANQANATVTVNDVTVTSGSASDPIALNVG